MPRPSATPPTPLRGRTGRSRLSRWSRSSCWRRGSRPDPPSPRPSSAGTRLLAIHFAGGGHNDAWMMAFVLGALALAGVGQEGARRRRLGCGDRDQVGAAPLPAAPAARGAPDGPAASTIAASQSAAVVIVAIATLRYGLEWRRSRRAAGHEPGRGPCVVRDPGRASRASASPRARRGRCVRGGVRVAYVWLLREAWRGRARLALTAGLLLVCTSWLVPWYAVWAVPLAAVEEDRTARVLALALSAYLLRDAVPI